jgi:radical SAM superfamily enzyme YgiQ (UPF0313 family)
VRVLLISANTETLNMPTLPLGLASVAAATQRAGHEVLLVNLMFQQDAESAIRDSIERFRPSLIGVSVRNIDDQNMERPQFLLAPAREVMASCRRLCSAPIVLGGAGYSIFPDSALRYLGGDMGIQGEGEAVFPALLERIERRAQVLDLPGVCLPGRAPERRSFAGTLDDLPFPRAAALDSFRRSRGPALGAGPEQTRLSHGLQLLFDPHHRGQVDTKTFARAGCELAGRAG